MIAVVLLLASIYETNVSVTILFSFRRRLGGTLRVSAGCGRCDLLHFLRHRCFTHGPILFPLLLPGRRSCSKLRDTIIREVLSLQFLIGTNGRDGTQMRMNFLIRCMYVNVRGAQRVRDTIESVSEK